MKKCYFLCLSHFIWLNFLIFFIFYFFFYFTEQYAGSSFLVPQPGMKPMTPVVEVQSLNHRTTREVPDLSTQSTFKSTIVAPHLKWKNKARIGMVNNLSQHASCMRFNLSTSLLKGDLSTSAASRAGRRVTRRKAVKSILRILFSPEVHTVLMTSSGGCPLVFLEGQYVGWGSAGDY